MSAVTVTTCQGCAKEIPPSRGGPARKWCSDTCRKRTLYSRDCPDCGATCNTDGRTTRPSTRCAACAAKQSAVQRTVWTREKVVAAIQDWACEYGGPPAAPDWNPIQARRMNDEARARRFEDANGRWPWMAKVINAFGTWNAGITAAGFEPRAADGGSGNQHRRRSVAS